MKSGLLFVLLICLFSCVLHAQVRFVCIGNSITQGKENRGVYASTSIGDSLAEMSYRFWLWERLDSAGLQVTFTGFYDKYFTEVAVRNSVSRYTGHTFPRLHEAYYGITSGGFLNGGWSHYPGGLPNFDTRLASYTPDVALIHLGTNDSDADVLQSELNLKTIIAKLRDRNPNVTILLARLMTDWKAISAAMPRIAQETTSLESIVYCVDMATGFVNDNTKPNTMTFDWVHPTRKGQIFMANRWYNAYMKVSGADTQAPSSPSNLIASGISANSATLSWLPATDNQGVNLYNVYINNTLYARTGKTSFLLSDYDLSTNPVVSVSAVDFQKNESPRSLEITLKGHYSVSFLIKENQQVLSDATVEFNSIPKTTSIAGTAIYSDVEQGVYDYSVSMAGFETVFFTDVTIAKDTIIELSLERILNSLPNSLESEIQVYPVPVSDMLTVGGANGSTLCMYSTAGQMVFRDSARSDVYCIDVSLITPGLYLLCVDRQGISTRFRVLIARQ